MGTATANKKPRRIDLKTEINSAYHAAINDWSRFLILYGGSGSGKSWAAAQKCLIRTMQEGRSKIVCTRKVARTIKNSVFALLLDIIDGWRLRHLFDVNLSDKHLTYIPNGNQILTLGMDDAEKVKSIQGVTSFWHEETTELSMHDLIQLDLRLRGETDYYFQHILTFNPVSRMHWLKRHFFDSEQPDVSILKTTYVDNPHVGEAYAARLEGLFDIDKGYHSIYALGEWGSLEGLIYKPFIMGPYPPEMEETIYGIDIGFRNPLVVIECGVADREVYLTERLYETGMASEAFGQWLESSGISKRACIYVDSASPDRIAEMRAWGYNAYPAHKGPGSVHAGIVFCRGLKLHSHPDNVNLNAEAETYKWREDKDGNPLDEPVKERDHAMDAMRYAIYTHYRPVPDDQDYNEVIVFDTIKEMLGGPIGAFNGM